MSISIADPFLLSTYTAKSVSQPDAASGPSKSTNVYATQQHASTSAAEGRYVTVAVQGEGVHILDVSTLHPVISHTLGPSVTFACPATTTTSQEDGTAQCSTFAVVETSQEIPTDERGRTVWMWREDPSGDVGATSEAQRKKSVRVLSHRVSKVVVAHDLPHRVLFIGTRGELTVTSDELVVQHTHTPSELKDNTRTFKSFVFSRQNSSFAPSRTTPKQGVLVLTVLSTSDAAQLQVLAVDENGAIVSLGTLPIPVQNSNILDVSCSETGCISVLARTGEWSIFQLEAPDYTTLSLTPRTPISLKTLSFIQNAASVTPSTPLSPYHTELALLSLGSSHVLLSGVAISASTGLPELVLLIWDLQYGVLLASHLFALPSSVSRSKKHGVGLALGGPSTHTAQVLLTLTSKTLGQGQALDVDRASVLVVPVVVPKASTIAAALGRAQAGERWLVSTANANGKAPPEPLGSASEGKLLKAIQGGVRDRSMTAVEEAFLAWVKEEEERERAPVKRNAVRTDGPSREFVRRVLGMLLPPPTEKDKDTVGLRQQYSSKIVGHLLDKCIVTSGVVHGGLVPALILRGDWASILIALKTVPDISETDVVSILHLAVSHHRQTQSSDGTAMQVDSATSAFTIPPLPTVLARCVAYSLSVPTLRLAIRTQIRDEADLTAILQVLVDWLAAWSNAPVSLLPAQTKTDAHGAIVPVMEEATGDIPPIDKVLAFLQTLLDASFLAFLSYPPAHASLRAALEHVEPALAFGDDLDQLRGVLQPFASAHARAVYESAHGPPKPELGGDWMRRRREAFDQAAISVGVYQIEEIVL